jgi:superfamily I DNA/RNA helicase
MPKEITVRFPAMPQRLKPTDEQAAIIATARTGDDLVVVAGAGSGKTSTQRMVGQALAPRRGYYIAYNKAIATDAKGTFPPNVVCATAHSFAFRAVGFKYQARLTDSRVPSWRVAEILGIDGLLLDADEEDGQQFQRISLEPRHLAVIAQDTVQNFCWSADYYISEDHVPREPKLSHHQNKMVARRVVAYAKRIWDDINLVDGGRMRFEHDHYLKMWHLSGAQLPADFILLDEAQDANPVIAAIIAQQRSAQKILVGDPAQQIYAWRGAIDAMDDFEGTRLPLSQSFRFGADIATEANRWLEKLGDFRITGHPGIQSQIGALEQPHAILCRSNAGVLAEVIFAQGNGLKVALVGGGSQLLSLARAAQQLQNNQTTSHRELMLFKSWHEVQEFTKTERAGSDLKVLVNLIDTYTPEGVINIVDSLVEEPQADIIVSTAHKAKGREWETVRVGPDFTRDPESPNFLLPNSEVRLAYVTVTRAKLQLDLGGLDWINHQRAL